MADVSSDADTAETLCRLGLAVKFLTKRRIGRRQKSRVTDDLEM